MADLRDDIELLREQKALLEASAEQTRRYGLEVEKNSSRADVYAKKLQDIRDIELKIIDIQSNKADLSKSLTNLTSGTNSILLRQLGLQDSVNNLKEAAKTNDEDVIENSRQLSSILERVLKGEMDANDVRRAGINLGGEAKKTAEEIAQSLENSPGLSEFFKVNSGVFDAIDNATGGILSTVQSIISAAGPIAALAAIFTLIVKKVIDVAKQTLEVRRNLGVSAGDALKLSGRMEAAALQTKLLGGDSEKAKELVTGLVTEFGNVEEASALSTKNIADLTTELGIGGGETAKLLKVLSDVSGESLDTLSSTLEFEASLARAEGIPVAKVMADVAQNADAFARAGADGADEVFRAARAAADLGTNLQTVEGVMDNLVDIEGSLTKEMEAEALIGRQLNLDRARQLAQANDQQGVIDEIIAQVGGPEAFARLGRIEQGALADVFGLSVGQLAPFLGANADIGGGGVATPQVLGANAGEGGGAVPTPQVAKDSLTAANNTNDILSKEHGKNQERHEQLLGAVQDLTRATKRAYA